MTKLVVVLAVVVVVILVIVIIAARSMKAEDPEEFADRPGGRSSSRGGQDDRDTRYERRERPPGRGGRGGRPSPRQDARADRPAAARAGRGLDERRSQPRSRRYDQRTQDGRGYETDSGFDSRTGRGYDERRGAQPTGPAERTRGDGPRGDGPRGDGPRGDGPRGNGRRGNGRTQHRPEESPAPARARQARGRRSGDSSEWDSSEWEKLSDVDYWAELASDKPLTTTAQPAAQPTPQPTAAATSGHDRDTEALTRRGPAPRRDPETGLPIRGPQHPADADLTVAAADRTDFTPAPVPFSGAPDPSRPVAAAPGEPRLSRHADPVGLPSLPSPGHSIPPGMPPMDPDDDPLTSPSFPRVPAADSRSYRNGRTDTPSRGSSASAPYLAPTQQFASYGSPAPSLPGHNRDTDTTHPNAYGPDPLLGRDVYPAPTDPAPARPIPAAPATTGNPYGSYVTPDTQAGYGEYPGAHSAAPGNGRESSYLPPALPGEAGQPAGNGYWDRQPLGPGGTPDSGTPGYLDTRGALPDPLGAGSHRADYGYGNGYGTHDPSDYQPGGYPAGPHDPAGYTPLDPYGSDGYGGYPGHGAAGH